MMWRIGLLGLACLASAAAFGQLTEKEQQGFDDALLVGGLKRSDLSYDRYSFAKPRMLSLIDMGISQPFDAASALMKLHNSANGATVAGMVDRAMYEGLSRNFGEAPKPTIGSTAGLEALPESLRAPVANLVAALRVSDGLIRGSLSEFKPAEQRTLIEALPRWAVDEPKVSFEFVKQSMPSDAELNGLLDRIKPLQIHKAGWQLAKEVEANLPALQASKDDVQGTIRLVIDRMVVEVSGRGADLHASSDARLVIDLGGDDLYTGRVGAGIGYSAVALDLGGNDRVAPRDLNLGVGLLGVGIAEFLGGSDVFELNSLGLGCGIAGVGIFSKEGGHDVYRAKTLAQGFGLAGLGLCADGDGNDSYDLMLMGQGAGRWFGMGWLVDEKGRDIYRAGGIFLNSPLFATAHYSFAQGFGMGVREDSGGRSGGIGLLTDFAGDDSYLGETYQQAASYWLALGSLYDGGGNDTYSGYHYCQASAMHLTGAYLFDLGGDDAYAVKVGAAHSIGHDYGTSFFLDRAGDDIYASRDSNPSVGTANGTALFLDGAGIDRYNGPSGAGNGSRGTGSFGIFADLGGQDLYRVGLADGQAVARPSWGVGFDQADPVVQTTAAAEKPWPAMGSVANPGEPAIAELYKKATQWGVGTATAEVEDSLRQLAGIGLPAWKYMLDKELARAGRLEIRAFNALAGRMGPEGKAALVVKADTAKGTELANVISISAAAGITELGPKLPPLIQEPTTRLSAINAAGVLKSVEAVPALVAASREGGLIARASMVALAGIGHADGLPIALALVAGSDPMTRKAALAFLAKHPEQAMSAAKELLPDAEEFRARVGLQIAGVVGTAEALNLIGGFLEDPRAAIRVEALLQLSGRCPEALKTKAKALTADPVPVVAATAKGGVF